ncbi:MAG: MFS transporter, partial [bacterium]
MIARRWLVLAVLVFARTGVGVLFIAVAALMPFIKADLGLNYTEVGILLGIFMISGVFLSLPSGMIATRLGDRGALWIGMASLLASSVLVAWSPTFAVALIGRLMGGLGAVFITVIASKIVIDWFTGKEIATAMSLLGVTWPIGFGLGMSLLPLLNGWMGWRMALLLTGALPVLAFLLTLTVPLTASSTTVSSTTGPSTEPPSAPRSAPQAAGEAEGAVPRKPLWVIGKKEFWVILTASLAWPLMNGGGYISFTSYAPLLLIERGSTPAAATAVISLQSWIFVLTIPIFGFVADRTGRGDLMYWLGTLIPAAAIAMTPVAGPMLLWLVPISLMGMTVGPIMAFPGDVLSERS